MIKFDNVSLAFSQQPLLDNVSFTIGPKEKCSLVGRNGSGKSTLFRLITGEIEPDQGTITISKDYRIGYLQQQITFSETSVIKEAALGLKPQDSADIYKAEKILMGLGFSEKDMEASPHILSGGYHLRLHLAKVLIAEPDCLLLDEPTNYLDILSLRWLKKFLSTWKGEFILISHDRNFLDMVSTHTMGIHRNKMRKIKGSTSDFFMQILLEEQVYEKTQVKWEKKQEHVKSYIERFGAKASKASQAQSKKKMLEKEGTLEKLNDLSSLSFNFNEAPHSGQKMLEATALQFSYSKDPLIENVSLEIEKGERIGIIGKNGRGKSTLLRLLAHDLLPQLGKVKVSENAKIGFFGQTNIERLSPELTIVDEISLANPSLSNGQIRAIAGVMMFSGNQAEKKIHLLSGGERSRVLLGKILAKPCNLLLLDEPTHHLDIESIEALIDALEGFSGSILLVTHSEFILRRLNLDKIILCEAAKQTVFLGNYDDFLEKKGWDEEKPLEKFSKKETKSPIQRKKEDLKPLLRKIQDAEKRLCLLEEEERKTKEMIDKGDTSLELFHAYASLRKEIEQLETALYDLYSLYENKKLMQ